MRKTGTLRSFLIVSRWEIQLVSFASATLGPILAASNLRELLNMDVGLFIVLFYLVATFSCNINCYYDVDVDALYKKRLSNAVRAIGRRRMAVIMTAEVLLAIAISIILALHGHLITSILAITGLLFAWAYSSPPFRAKGHGLWGQLLVNTGIYVLPLLGGYLILSGEIAVAVWAFILLYAIMNTGINLVNSAEDYQEDKEIGIRTAAHALGIKRTMRLAVFLMLTGYLSLLFILLAFYRKGGWSGIAGVSILSVAALFFIFDTVKCTLPEADMAGQAKRCGKRVPLWFVITRYPIWLFLLLYII